MPKFGSFKPKAPVEDESREGPKTEKAQRTEGGERRGLSRHKSRHNDGNRDQHRSGRYYERPASREPHSTEPLREPKHLVDELFTFDKRGDPLIVRYRGNDRSRVPAYRRIRRGIVLGSIGYLALMQDGPREQFSIQLTREGRSAFHDKNLLAQAGRTESRLFKSSTQQSSSAVNEDFIALEPPRKRMRRDNEDDDSSSDRERHSYRSIEGKAKVREGSDSASESDSGNENAEQNYITPAKRSAIGLTQTVKERPADVAAWLELVSLQDVLFKENEDNDHVRTRDETKALADIKVSMFEKALPHATSPEARERLLVGLMREGSRVWKPDKLARRWVEVTEHNADSFALWKSRMDFEQGNIASFSFDDIKQRFIDRLRFVERKLSGEAGGEAGQRRLADEAIYVLLRLTRFLDEAGFLDLAVGTWQALLELHFARAILPDERREFVMNSLGEFWDSEVPRIGESGALGWKKFVDNGSIGDIPETGHQEPRTPPQTTDVYEAWAATETQQALKARVPARTVDEGTDDDPYRVVMFADIEPFLIAFPSHVLELVRKQLLDAYLLFCHLPPAFGLDSYILQCATSDPFIYGGSRDFEQSLLRPTESVDIAAERKRQPPNFRQDGHNTAISPDVLFAGPGWFNYLAGWRELYPDHDEPIERVYIRTTVRQVVRACSFETLAEYHLAMEWACDPAGAKKAAKAVLRQYPSNARLYNAYALVECANGNLETSYKVLQTAIGQGLASGAAGQELRNTWAWIELDAGQLNKALGRLCSMEDARDVLPTPALILKARSELRVQRDALLSVGDATKALHYAVGLALLAYLSPIEDETNGKEPRSVDQGNVTAAMATCNAFSADLTSRGLAHSLVHERYLQFAARLVYYHATHGSVDTPDAPLITC